ncbi:MAG: hypothetical protein HAW67_06475 [Endozoicomonadaceae bacterium]|nr:hypothetical protein [Endozoicomonadaceae bacterium]
MESEIKPDGTQIKITIIVSTPTLIDNDYRCEIKILGLDYRAYSYGVDAVQSCCMMLACIKCLFKKLDADGWVFYYPHSLEEKLDINSIYFK